MVVVYWPLVVAFQETDSCLKLQEARAILSELGQIQHANSTDIDGFICISMDSRYFRYLFVQLNVKMASSLIITLVVLSTGHMLSVHKDT